MYRLINAEEVLDLLLNKISLSRYDQKFFYNLQLYNVLPQKPITSNQANLFSKVVQKYQTQLKKIQLDALELSMLPWTLKVIPSSSEFTQAAIKIENNQIILRCPFKTAFVADFREQRQMVWNRDERYYHTEYGLYKLKNIIDTVSKHYTEVHFCETTLEILNQILPYKLEDCWNPTLYKRNNLLFIGAINESLYEAIESVELNLDLKTLTRLSSYGIKIDVNLYNELLNQYSNDELSLVCNREHKHDFQDLPRLLEILEKIGCDFIQYTSLYTPQGQNEIADRIESLTTIPVKQLNMKTANKAYSKLDYDMPVMIKSNSFTFKNGSMFYLKVVELVNNNPIELK